MANEDKNTIGVLFGAGTHIYQLEKAILSLGKPVIIVKYHPTFTISRYNSKGELVNTTGSKKIDFTSKLYWFIKHRFYKKGEGKQWLQRLYNLYDKKAAPYLKNCGTLIAWPLISENCMRAVKQQGGKVILEYPMIHVSAWQHAIRQEYKKNHITHGENLFIPSAEQKILREIQLADTINVLSTYAARTFISNGIPSEKINILAPTGHVRKPEITIKEFNAAKPVFIYVGRLDVNKGAQYLCRAFTKLQLPAAQLRLAGRITPEFEKLKSEFEKNRQIYFLGHLNEELLTKEYTRANFLVLPSVQESYGMVIHESMAHGITVLASAHTGAPDIITNGVNGYIFEPSNEESLLACMQQAIKNGPFNRQTVQNSIPQFQSNAYIEGWKKLLARQ